MVKVDYKNAVVFITGANRPRGIGRALVLEAVKRGAKKVYATARNTAELDELVAKNNGVVVAVRLDVTNRDDVMRAASMARDTQILINNSGFAEGNGVCFNHDDKSARLEMEVNFWGVINVTRALCKTIIENRGAIANVVSIAGLSSFPASATYSASKAAAHSLTQAVRAEMAPHHVAVFGIYPGPIDTDMADSLQFAKGTTADAAVRVFDGMQQGIEDITTDKFADEFLAGLRRDAKDIERGNANFVHGKDF